MRRYGRRSRLSWEYSFPVAASFLRYPDRPAHREGRVFCGRSRPRLVVLLRGSRVASHASRGILDTTLVAPAIVGGDKPLSTFRLELLCQLMARCQQRTAIFFYLQPYLDWCGSCAIGDPISWKRNSRKARVPSKSSTRRSSASDRSADTMSKCAPYRSFASVIGI